MPYKLVTFDGLTLPIYHKEGDALVGAAETGDDLVRLAGGHTWDARRGDRARPFQMRYTVDCLLLATEATLQTGQVLTIAANLQTQEDALIAKAGVKGTLTRQTYAGAQQTIAARLSIPEIPERIGGQSARSISLVFDVETPGWLGTNRNVSMASEDNWDSVTLTAVNNGNYPFVAPVLTITAGAAPVTAFTFLAGPDSQGRKWMWAWAGTLAAGKALIIDCGAMTVTNDGAADYGLTLDATHNQNEWVVVPNGGLDFAVTVTPAVLENVTGGAALTYTSYDVFR